VVWVWIVEEDPHARFRNGKDDSQHWVICTRFPLGAFPLAQLHYQCIRPTPPSVERTPTAAGMEKEKRKTCRRAGVVLVRRVGSESRERWANCE
jgi:hypothetical protein